MLTSLTLLCSLCLSLVVSHSCNTDGENEETYQIIEAIQDTLQLFRENLLSVTTDVVLGLIITRSFINAIPEDQRIPALEKIIEEADEIIVDFQQGEGDHSKSDKLIPVVLNNSLWNNAIHPLRAFADIEDLQGFQQLPIHQQFENYADEMKHSEMCLLELYRCNILPNCLSLPNRASSKYADSHFLLFLTIARSYPCTRGRISSDLVNTIQMKLCENMAFQNDALLLNELLDLESKDIFLERIALCGLNGFVDFLRKNWLGEILRWHRSDNCFNKKNPRFRIKRNDSALGFHCHSHSKAVGLAALAFYLRGIATLCLY